MKRLSRCVLVGMLVTTLAVDFAAARLLFGRRRCRAKCIEVCSPKRVDTCSFDTCKIPPTVKVSAPECVAALMEMPSARVVDESAGVVDEGVCSPCDTAPQPNVEHSDTTFSEQALPSYAPVENFDPLGETVSADPSHTPIDTPSLPPEQPAAPESVQSKATESKTNLAENRPTPTPVPDQPEHSVLGDRYSEPSVLGPQAREDTAKPEPAVLPTVPADEPPDPFDEPAASTVDEGPEVTLPEPDIPEQDTSEPNTSEVDPFGPIAPADNGDSLEIEETQPEATEPEQIEPKQTELEQTDSETQPAVPEQSEPEEAEPAEEKKFEPYDPFGNDRPNLEQQPDKELTELAQPGGLRSTAMRTWSDIRTKRKYDAKLVRATTKQVVLRRATGVELSVSLRHLATKDLHFLKRQVSALRIVRARAQAAELLVAGRSN